VSPILIPEANAHIQKGGPQLILKAKKKSLLRIEFGYYILKKGKRERE
jgi:hypothetical protein